MHLSRRSLLSSTAGAVLAGATAGCLDEPSSSAAEGGYAAFFPLWDWSEQVSGDEITFENALGIGQMGHGTEPPGDLQRDIAGSSVFVYLDSEEFGWAQEYAAEFERDYDDITVIDGMDGLDGQLLEMDIDGLDREPPDYEFDPESLEISEFDLYDHRTSDELGYWHDTHWHGGVPDVPVDGEVTVTGVFEDDEGRVLPLGSDEQFQIDARLDGGSDEGIEIDSHGDHVAFTGVEPTQVRVVFELVANGDVIWETDDDPIVVSVVSEPAETDGPTAPDPHVWLDPVLAQDIVDTIAEGLGEADPDNADLYAENAAAYADKLADVDEQFRDLTADADQEIAVFAGHDSYQYIEARYGFELHTPVGISPDEAETSEDISEIIDVIEEHDLETILYDPLETQNPGEDVPQMVELLLEETDATDAEPLTPIEGTTEEWHEAEYGWIDQMEQINIPSLKRALGA